MTFISNDQLHVSDVPEPETGWERINDFAHTFDGYERWGSFERCAEVAHSGREDSLDELRTALFFLARAVRHGGYGPSDDDIRYADHLVTLLRNKLSGRGGGSLDFTIPLERFDNVELIEERVADVEPADQGAFRSALKYLYLTAGPVNLPRERLLAAELYMEPRERILARWLYTRTNGSERKRYGARSLVRARTSRYRCEECDYADVRAIELDHVDGRVEGTSFACLCANCHTIKSRAVDWSGERRYARRRRPNHGSQGMDPQA
jgi:hypothetical protein